MKFTVFGGTGFIGANLSAYLRRKGHEVFVPARDGDDALDADLGHVIYAIGMTGNFRSKPFSTVEAHVGMLARLLEHTRFDSWLYLSSTRVYKGVDEGRPVKEDAPMPVTPDADSLYDISKLMGEALCLVHPSPRVRIARLANVYGPGQNRHTFLAAVIEELSATGNVKIMESPASAKDYVAISDVITLVEKIILSGRERIYTVASGTRVTHAELAAKLSALTGGTITFAQNAPTRVFPEIDITRVADEFGHIPAHLTDNLTSLLPISHIRST